jgi:DNA polymerase-4
MRDIIHLNFVGFMAGVAAALDKQLRRRPFVIRGTLGGRAVAADVSAEALQAGIVPGMALTLAEKKARDLVTVAPDPPSYAKCNQAIGKIASRYAPVFQHDGKGNWYLDITGTAGLFGPPADCTSRVLSEVLEDTGMYPAAAAAGTKLVGKVATRTIRPTGLIAIRSGDEGAFLAHQDIRLLPGMGPSLLRTIAVTGFREAGELAALSDGEALALFGLRGLVLRDAARGLDDSPVLPGNGAGMGTIERRLDFEQDVIDFETIRGALLYLAENAGVDMRKDKLGASCINLITTYADGMSEQGTEKGKRLFILDREIGEGAERLFRRIVTRRIRIRSLALALGGLRPLGWEPDLFLPEEDEKQNRLQEAADKLRGRYGLNIVTKGLVLAASRKTAGLVPSLPFLAAAHVR